MFVLKMKDPNAKPRRAFLNRKKSKNFLVKIRVLWAREESPIKTSDRGNSSYTEM